MAPDDPYEEPDEVGYGSIVGGQLGGLGRRHGELGVMGAHRVTRQHVHYCQRAGWPQREPGEFTITGRDERTWTDRKTGERFKRIEAHVYDTPPDKLAVAAWVLAGGEVWLLAAEGQQIHMESQPLGEVGAIRVERQVVPISDVHIY